MPMHLWTTSLERPQKGAPIAAFDYDETLGRGVLHWKFLPHLTAGGHIRDPQQDEFLAQAYKDRAKRERSYKIYEDRLIEVSRTRYKEAGMSRERLGQLAKEFLSSRALLEEQYAFSRALFLTLREQGYALVLISLCPIEILHPLAEAMGFHFAIGNVLQADERGFFTGEEGRLPVKDEDLRALVAEQQYTFEHSVAIGDSTGDLLMLKQVEYGIAFNPKPALRQVLDTDTSCTSISRIVERAEVVTSSVSEWMVGETAPRIAERRLEDVLPLAIATGVRTKLEAIGYYLF